MTTKMMTDIMTTTDGCYILCEDCDVNFALHEFVGSENKTWNLCDKCNHEAWEAYEEMREIEREEEDLGTCVSCKTEKAVISFMHMKNGNFELCNGCFEWADHEDDYGQTREDEEGK